MTLPKTSRILAILAVLILPSVGYLLLYTGKNNYKKLEIFGPREAPAESGKDTIYHTVSDFTLTGQDGKPFSMQNLEGKYYVADFFFSTCKTICPEMTTQMKKVQEAFLTDSTVMLVSFTVNPERDTVETLAAYAQQYQAKPGKWFFVTGDKKIIYDLARNSYFITALKGNGGPDDFIHSEKLVLIDKDRRIRGFYDGTDYEDVNRLIEEIQVLQWEYKQKKS